MRILIDTNVLLDVGLARTPHLADSAAVLRWAASGGDAAVAWHSLSNCAYMLKSAGREFIERLLKTVVVAGVGHHDALTALSYPMRDFEDALQAAAAVAWRADVIVTRNVRDYVASPVAAATPTEFLSTLNRTN